jgi:formylmethanofuran dehydrogenase subunit C
MGWQLTYRHPQSIPVELEGITPDRLAGQSLAEVERLPVMVGNRTVPLAELFTIAGSGSDLRIDLEGDCSGVHWIGAKMGEGDIFVHGSAGRHVGSEMAGGRIEVEGSAGDWVGAELRSGTIRVRGNAGHLVGAAYRGSRKGMTGGTILVHGSAGNEVGHTMRRGLIAVGGDVGDVVGFGMLAGTILVAGQAGIRHGAGMKRGTLIFLNAERPPLLPTFRFACRYRPPVMTPVLRALQADGFPLPTVDYWPQVDLYNGDLLVGGRGELWLGACGAC